MESKAILKFARVAPRKARRVLDLIKGKKAGDALIALKFMPYRAADIVEKVLKSAVANAEQKKAASPEDMNVKGYIDQGPSIKRMEPRSMGRANVIKKRMSHITIILEDKENKS